MVALFDMLEELPADMLNMNLERVTELSPDQEYHFEADSVPQRRRRVIRRGELRMIVIAGFTNYRRLTPMRWRLL